MIRLNLPQLLVYWAPAGNDSFGRPRFADPVELACRWEDTVEESISSTGDMVYSSAVVYTAQRIAPKSVMWLSPTNRPGDGLKYIQGSSWLPDLKANPDTHEVINTGYVPSLKGTQNLARTTLK